MATESETVRLKMTVDEAIAFADEWTRGMTLHADSQGWRVVCLLLADEVRRLRTPSVEAKDAWLPIETAPRDGSRIILGREDEDGDGGVSVCGYWLDALEDGVDYMGNDGGFTDVDYQVFQPSRTFGAESYRHQGSQPTRWMPMPPAPPAIAQQDAQRGGGDS